MPSSAKGLLTWAQVEQRLIDAQHYWLTTVRPDGRPHVVPRWGVWLDGRFFYDGAPTTRHARNLRSNPHCSLNLESGWEAVIVEGTSAPTRADEDGLGRRLAEAYGKYAPGRLHARTGGVGRRGRWRAPGDHAGDRPGLVLLPDGHDPLRLLTEFSRGRAVIRGRQRRWLASATTKVFSTGRGLLPPCSLSMEKT